MSEAGQTWNPINLAATEFAQPTEPPAICGLLYQGKRHALSGPPEAAKTLAAHILALESMRNRPRGDHQLQRLLRPHRLRERPTRDPPAPRRPRRHPRRDQRDPLLRARRRTNRQRHLHHRRGGRDARDHRRRWPAPTTRPASTTRNARDVERFARTWIKPLWQQGIATIAIDHVVKNHENRGKFSIGSERKLGTVDVHLGLKPIKQLHRGSTGLITCRPTRTGPPTSPGPRRRARAPQRPGHPRDHLGVQASRSTDTEDGLEAHRAHGRSATTSGATPNRSGEPLSQQQSEAAESGRSRPSIASSRTA